jgi:ATP-dependent DNA ligase
VGALNRVPCFTAEGGELFEAACRLDLEGIVGKRRADVYAPETRLVQDQEPELHRGSGAK